MAKKILFGLTLIALVPLIFIFNSNVNADTYRTNDQIEEAVSGLKDSDYVLALSDGSYIANMDGNPNFSEEQINETGGTVKSVKDYKEQLKTTPMIDGESQTAFRAASPPGQSYVLYANQQYTSQAFSGKGWRYSGYNFRPITGTGSYLLWEAFVDSGVVVTKVQGDVVVNPGAPRRAFSDAPRGTYTWGAYFKTYNPIPGSYYRVSNPV